MKHNLRRPPVGGDEAFARAFLVTEANVTQQARTLDDEEKLRQQLRFLGWQEVLVHQETEELAGWVHRVCVSAQVSAQKC